MKVKVQGKKAGRIQIKYMPVVRMQMTLEVM